MKTRWVHSLPTRDTNYQIRAVAVLSLALLILPAVGCGDGRPKRLSVSGQVMIDGEPLTHGFVRFVPRGARPSSGRLDDEGRFTLSCFGKNDGIVPGIHRVEVNASEPISSTKIKWHAPPKYASFRNSELEQEITGPTDSLVISLTWAGGKPFVQRVRGGGAE